MGGGRLATRRWVTVVVVVSALVAASVPGVPAAAAEEGEDIPEWVEAIGELEPATADDDRRSPAMPEPVGIGQTDNPSEPSTDPEDTALPEAGVWDVTMGVGFGETDSAARRGTEVDAPPVSVAGI